MYKNIAIISLVLAAAVMGYWAVDGQHPANQFEVQKVTMVEDEFGDKMEKKEWVEEFHLGFFDGALPASLGFAGLGFALLLWDWRRSSQKGA